MTTQPKTLRTFALKHPEIVQAFVDDDGAWLWLRPDLINPELECGTYHEATVAAVCRAYVANPPITNPLFVAYQREQG